ncbi:MAG TPA: ABC transporter substrate-binding protein [Candidatus Limnocylindria bacterium]|nr:ABC transporter substrate-binding protein [Candidatus Limnocylindria bacterium]
MTKKIAAVVLFTITILSVNAANALDTVTAALTSKAFQYVPLVIAQERGYMREEGLELKLVFMQNAPGLQALIANAVQFSGSGSSALVAISKGNAPLKTILAFNDQVLQWIVARPNIKTLRDLTGKKVATTGVASIAAYMFRNILTKHNIPKDIVLIDPGPVNRLPSLLSGAVDAAIVSPEERYAALDQGMRDLVFIGKEVKNSWGTFATSERFIKEQAKQLAGFVRAVVKGLRVARQERESTIAAISKFSELDKTLSTRMYDDLVNTFTKNGYVDEQSQRNDLAIVAQVAEVNEVVPPKRAYDFSFAIQAEQQLNKQGWKP